MPQTTFTPSDQPQPQKEKTSSWDIGKKRPSDILRDGGDKRTSTQETQLKKQGRFELWKKDRNSALSALDKNSVLIPRDDDDDSIKELRLDRQKRLDSWRLRDRQDPDKPSDILRDRIEEDRSTKNAITESKRYFGIEETKSTRKANESLLAKAFSDLRYRNHKKAGSRYKEIYDDMAKFLVDKDKKDKIKYQGMNEIATIDNTGLGKEIIYHRLVTSHPKFHDLYTAAMQGKTQEVKDIIGNMRLSLKVGKPLAKMDREGHITFETLDTTNLNPSHRNGIIGTNKLVTRDFKDFTYSWHDAKNNIVLSTSHTNTLAAAKADRLASTYTITPKTIFRFHEGTLIAAEDIDFEKTLQPNRSGQPDDAPKPENSLYHKNGYEINLKNINELGNPAREEARNTIRHNYDDSAAEHLQALEKAVETGKSEFVIGQIQKIYRENLATTYLVEAIQKDVLPIKEDIQAFYAENHFRALQKLNSSEILARVLKDPEFLEPIHSYTQNIEDVKDNALRAGVSRQDIRTSLQQIGLQDYLHSTRSDIHTICLDIHNTDNMQGLQERIENLTKHAETPTPTPATPQEKLQRALENVVKQDHNAKVQALQDAFKAWDIHKTTENADALKLTASHIADFTARNDHNRACLLKSLDHDQDSQASRRERSLILRNDPPLTTKELNHKFNNLRKDIPELQKIKALNDKLEKNLEAVYEHPVEYATLVTSTIDELVPLMRVTRTQLLLNEGRTGEAEMIMDKSADAERVLKERLQAVYNDALNKYHDLKKLDRAHKHAMKHLMWYALMYLGEMANQGAANTGQDFKQAANNVFRGSMRS